MIAIDLITDAQLRAVRDAVVLFRSIRVWHELWGEYEYVEPVMICQLQSLPMAVRVSKRLAADMQDPVFHWKNVKAVSDCDLARLRSHVTLERDVRDYLKNLETSQ